MTLSVVGLGEAMIEFAPVGEGLYRRAFAGDTFNTVWHMAQLMGSGASVGFVTRIGSDSLSDAFVAELTADGMAVAGILRNPAATMGLYLIDLDGVERSFHYWRSASAARHLADDPGALGQSLAGAGLIHLSGITVAILRPEARETLLAVLAEARAGGARISFDPNIRPRLWSSAAEIRETIPRFLALTDIALPSFDDEAGHWGDATPEATVARFTDAGVAEVVVKNGAGPVMVRIDGTDLTCDTPPVSDIRDTTGAGDAFNAGYLAARLSGARPARAVAAGQRLSAEVIRTAGARLPRAAARALSDLAAP